MSLNFRFEIDYTSCSRKPLGGSCWCHRWVWFGGLFFLVIGKYFPDLNTIKVVFVFLGSKINTFKMSGNYFYRFLCFVEIVFPFFLVSQRTSAAPPAGRTFWILVRTLSFKIQKFSLLLLLLLIRSIRQLIRSIVVCFLSL